MIRRRGMNTKLSNKLISTTLAFMMFLEVVLLGYAPVVSAKENTEPPKETSRQSDVIEKSEDYTVYENEDGTFSIEYNGESCGLSELETPIAPYNDGAYLFRYQIDYNHFIEKIPTSY